MPKKTLKLAELPGRAFLAAQTFREPVPILVLGAQRQVKDTTEIETVQCSSLADFVDVCARVERGEVQAPFGMTPELQFLVALAMKTGFARPRRKRSTTRR